LDGHDGLAAPHLRLSHRISYMVSGWIQSTALGPQGGGTASLTIGCPDDFHAVRLGFPNLSPTPWTIERVIGRASTTYNDYVNPTGGGAWTDFTVAMDGRADERIVTRPDAPTRIVVAGNAPDPATGETGEPAWTWTDWVPLASLGADPANGMRVLMLRALIPCGQTVCFANGQFLGLLGNTALNRGFDCFTGGLKHNYDRVSTTGVAGTDTTRLWTANQLAPGSLFPLVQFLTRRPGVVGMAGGDSHQQGTSTTEQFTSFLYRATTALGGAAVGKMPFGMVNCAVGGLTSARFFARLEALLPAVRPSYAVLPGWTFNDRSGEVDADEAAMRLFHARLLLAIEACRRHGALPIVLTPFPRNAARMTAVQLAPWRWLRGAVLDLRPAGVAVLDATAILGARTGEAFDGGYLPGMSTDTRHPGDAGHEAVGAALAALLKRRLPAPVGVR